MRARPPPPSRRGPATRRSRTVAITLWLARAAFLRVAPSQPQSTGEICPHVRRHAGRAHRLYLETALTFEFRRPANGRPRMVSPFLLVSGGVWVQRFQETRFFREWTRTEPAWGVMVGARLFLPFARGRMYVAPEVGYAALTTVAAPVTFGWRSAVRTVARQWLSESTSGPVEAQHRSTHFRRVSARCGDGSCSTLGP